MALRLARHSLLVLIPLVRSMIQIKAGKEIIMAENQNSLNPFSQVNDSNAMTDYADSCARNG